MNLSNLDELFNACFTGLYVETSEADEAEREIAVTASKREWQVRRWDAARGLTGPNGEQMDQPGDPMAPTRDRGPNQTPTVTVLHNYHRFLEMPVVMQHLANAVLAGKAERHFYVILAPVVKVPAELEKLLTVVRHELPSQEQLEKIALELLNPEERPENIAQPILRAASGLTRYEAENALTLSLVRHGQYQEQTLFEQKAQCLNKVPGLSLHRGAEGFKDLGGMDALKTFSTRALRPDTNIRARGVMLLGISGTGKSAFAKALGNEVGRPTISLDVGGLYAKHVGDSEANVRRALAAADAMSPCLLFIDEVEKALAGAKSDGDSGVAARLFGTLLTWLNDHTSDVFVVCTANDISRLPETFTRAERFDGVFFLDLPTFDERDSIWRLYIQQYGLRKEGEVVGIPVAENWTGAEIKACCRLAKLLDLNLGQAAEQIVPVAITAATAVEELRIWAENRVLSATNPGVYRRPRLVGDNGRRRNFTRGGAS